MCIFLANNVHYMVMSVRRYITFWISCLDHLFQTVFLTNNVLSCHRSEAKDILGDDWIQRHRRIVQQNAKQYKRVAWGKVSVSVKYLLIGCTVLLF
jgi:hypothetical protein